MSEATDKAALFAAAATAATRDFKISIGPVTDCTARCVRLPKDSPERKQCLQDCKEAEAIAALAERLHRELARTFLEVIWQKGNIDPLPELARQIVDRFASNARAPLG